MKSNPISFENTEIAFAQKSSFELQKTYWLFKLLNNNTFVELGTSLTEKALKLHLPIGLGLRYTIFEQFCGGTSLEKSKPVIKQLFEKNKIYTLLNYSVEALEDEQSFENTLKETLRAVEFAGSVDGLRAICIKFTGFGYMELFEKIQRNEPLTPEEDASFEKTKARIDLVCKTAEEFGTEIYVDAEESWIQDVLDLITEEMMEKYNTRIPIVFNTFQLYRADKLEYFKKSIQTAKEKGYVLGAKLVRGAYVDKEKEYATEHHLSNPIHRDKPSVDADFNEAVTLAVKNIDVVSFCCASHNEYSNLFLAKLIAENNIPKDHPHILFSQLYGMGDHISYNLSNAGYAVAKYIPYGPVKDVIPYLLRRAKENTSVAGQTSREYALLEKEIERRKN